MENNSNTNTISELKLSNYLLKIDRNEDEKEWLEMFQEEIENQEKYEIFCNDLLENIDNYYSYADPEQ